MKILLVVLAFLPRLAIAGDFAARVKAGNEVMLSPQGKTYDTSLAPVVQAAMSSCAPAGSTSKSNLGKFVLVGTISAAGKVSSIEVAPATKVAHCFAASIAAQRLPAPPRRASGTYPLTIELTVGP